MTHEPISDELIHIKQLERQLFILHWLILSVGIITLIIFSLNNHLFENIIFLPILGLIGYLFIRHLFIIPSITTFLLLLTHFLMDLVSPKVDTAWNYIFYFFIFFCLTLLGSLCGYALIKSIHFFKTTHGIKKASIFCSWVVLCGIIVTFLINFININGNPISSYYAECRMQSYLRTAYPDQKVTLTHIQYYFKDHSYSASASLYNEENALQPFNIYYKKNHVTDDYFKTYLEDEPNEYRLNKEISDDLASLLTIHHISFSTINSTLQLQKNTYDQIHFDPEDFNVPLSLCFTLLTDEKQSNEDFSLWCESIRKLLLEQGYEIDNLRFISSPHWDANSLTLYLSDDLLTQPIVDVTTYARFKDIGLTNHLSPSDHNPTPYNDYDLEPQLAQKIEEALKSPALTPLYVEASATSLGKLKLKIYWTGKRISVDHYAETTIQLFNQLISKDLMHGYFFQSITFQYGWGTSSESYEYTVYPENVDTQTTDMIIDSLLN